MIGVAVYLLYAVVQALMFITWLDRKLPISDHQQWERVLERVFFTIGAPLLTAGILCTVAVKTMRRNV